MCCLSRPQKTGKGKREKWQLQIKSGRVKRVGGVAMARLSMYFASEHCTSRTGVGQNHHYQRHTSRQPQLKVTQVQWPRRNAHYIAFCSNASAMLR